MSTEGVGSAGCRSGEWRLLLEKARSTSRADYLEELRECFILESPVADELKTAYEWIRVFSNTVRMVVDRLGVKGVLLPKEMKSFIENPLHHLSKKLFIYSHDLLKGKMSPEEFEKTGLAAIRTSLRTNLRSIYEAWVLLAIALELSHRRVELVYPEHGFILIERSGRQRGGNIPPSFIIHVYGRGMLSFYLEAPRPISWGDTRDLQKAWKLYVALRPDIMVYGGLVTDIVQLSANPPIKQPDVIIEVKELSDWYARTREIRGPFARSLSAEEWRDRWIRGLWAGLADVLGVKSPEAAYEEARKRRGLRLSEPQIVKLYARIYKPRRLFLVSREKVPPEVRESLEDENVTVVDGVGFNASKLRTIVEYLESIASYRGVERLPVYIRPASLKLLETLAAELGVGPEKVLEAVLEVAAGSNTCREVLRRRLVEKNNLADRADK